MLRATSVLRQAGRATETSEPFDRIVLDHAGRHLRRKTLTLQQGDRLLVDLPQAVALDHGDCLVLEDGRLAEIIAAEEELMEVRGHGALHHAQLCWHIGNRHLTAQIETDRILLQRDPVIAKMLEGLGATLRPVVDLFTPVRGAYGDPHQGHHHHG